MSCYFPGIGAWHQRKRVWIIPTTMDSKEDSLKHATKMLQGKTTHLRGDIRTVKADQMMMEEIK